MNSNKKLWEQNWNRWRHIYYPSTGLKTLLPISTSVREDLEHLLDNRIFDKSPTVFFLPGSLTLTRGITASLTPLRCTVTLWCLLQEAVVSNPLKFRLLQKILHVYRSYWYEHARLHTGAAQRQTHSLTLTQGSCGYNWPQLNPTPKGKAKRFKAQ